MEDPLVTIAKFSSALDANLARAQLEAVGIRAFVTNEMTAGYGSMGGEVGLQVRESDELDAIAVLNGDSFPGGATDRHEHDTGPPPIDPFAKPGDSPSGWKNREEPERCPVCEGSLVEEQGVSAPLRLIHFVLSLALPLPEGGLRSRGRRCGVCGYRWKVGNTGVTSVPTIDS